MEERARRRLLDEMRAIVGFLDERIGAAVLTDDQLDTLVRARRLLRDVEWDALAANLPADGDVTP